MKRGDRIALDGKNGSGKSSLLKLLLGTARDYEGRFVLSSGLIVSYVPQDSSFLRGALRDHAAVRRLDESLFKAILRKLDFSRSQFEKNMEDFSEGQRKKVLIAASLCESAHLYLWDEPLNSIDLYCRMQIEESLRSFESTMVFVEHDQAFMNALATKVVLVRGEERSFAK